jgi:hypothetical protein
LFLIFGGSLGFRLSFGLASFRISALTNGTPGRLAGSTPPPKPEITRTVLRRYDRCTTEEGEVSRNFSHEKEKIAVRLSRERLLGYSGPTKIEELL